MLSRSYSFAVWVEEAGPIGHFHAEGSRTGPLPYSFINLPRRPSAET